MSKAKKPDKALKPGKLVEPVAYKGFDIDNPELPGAIADAALASGGFPFDQNMKRKEYEEDLISLLVRDGMHLVKFYLTVGREMKLKRFHERRHDPLKQGKLTEIDMAAIGTWDNYTTAEAEMLRFTHTNDCAWTIVHANDQRVRG